MARFANSVLFTPTAGGTTDFTVSAAVTGYMTPALAGAPTGVYKYRAESSDLAEWEIGEGTYTSGTGVLTRTTVLYNSAGTGTASGQSGAGSKINFAVAPNVGFVQAVEDTLGIDQANAFTAAQQSQGRKNLNIYWTEPLASSQDFDSATTPGRYYTIDSTSTNAPTAGAFWYLDVEVYGTSPTSNRRQIAHRLDASVPEIYIRSYASAAWSAWRRCVRDNEIGVYANAARGQPPGETGASAATSGNIGEYNSASGNSGSLTTGVNANCTSISVPAGDFEVDAIGFLSGGGSTSMTNFTFSISTTSGAHNTGSNDRYEQWRNAGAVADPFRILRAGTLRVSQAAAATHYAVVVATFTGTAPTVSAIIRYRRAR